MKKLGILLAVLLALCASPAARGEGGAYPSHQPYGVGVGVCPGRVAWAYEPDAVRWDGEGYWWEPSHYDGEAVRRMVDGSVRTLGGGETAKESWDALFAYTNARRGRPAAGYAPGEKIAVKANLNGSGVFDDDTSGRTAMSYTNPVLLQALLASLVEEAGVPPEDITVYDVSRLFPAYMTELCSQGPLRGVRFAGRDDGVADEGAPIRWSRAFGGNVNYLPTCVTEAEYVVNLANLKGHSYGITLCAKNHFGSFINGNAMRPPEGANLHQWLTMGEMGVYSPLVDLMANADLGGKTVLYLLDALVCAPSEGASITAENATWLQPPFNGGYTASVFASQDPVAIDSVGADFLMNEPTVVRHNAAAADAVNENYLHEAGLVSRAPSGTVYTDGNGANVANLGVHEHWNNAEEKRYSRDLGAAEGIELARVDVAEPDAGRVLVVYFSCTGNTQSVAEELARLAGADVARIVPRDAYTAEDLNYNDKNSRANREIQDEAARPAIADGLPDLAPYGVVCIGYPIWWGDLPPILRTFMESYDFAGKTLLPFCTSGGSGVATSVATLRALAPDADVRDGLRAQAGNCEAQLAQWLADNQLAYEK